MEIGLTEYCTAKENKCKFYRIKVDNFHSKMDNEFIYERLEDSLNGNNISVRLRAKVKDYVMLNKSIEFAENESNVNLGSLNWKIDPKDTKGYVKNSPSRRLGNGN